MIAAAWGERKVLLIPSVYIEKHTVALCYVIDLGINPPGVQLNAKVIERTFSSKLAHSYRKLRDLHVPQPNET